MRTDIKKRWMDALRSGEYKQGKGCLARNCSGEKEYCCLGVLCDIYMQDHPNETMTWEYDLDDSTNETKIGSLHGTEFVLPHKVQEWSGLGEAVPMVDYRYSHYMISELNDSHNMNFNKLADLIEEEL
jgi:hypothetical protein